MIKSLYLLAAFGFFYALAANFIEFITDDPCSVIQFMKLNCEIARVQVGIFGFYAFGFLAILLHSTLIFSKLISPKNKNNNL